MKYLIASITLSLLVACSNNPPLITYKPIPLYAPPKPTLPTWSASDMQCLPIPIKQKILDRDISRKNYQDQLILIINSTHD